MALTYKAYCEHMECHGFTPMTAKEWFKDEQERIPQVRKKKVVAQSRQLLRSLTMMITIKDIHRVDPSILSSYLHRYCRREETQRLIDGVLYSMFRIEALRNAMEEKIYRAINSLRLPQKSRELSIRNAEAVLTVLNQIEGKHNEK